MQKTLKAENHASQVVFDRNLGAGPICPLVWLDGIRILVMRNLSSHLCFPPDLRLWRRSNL